MALGLTGWHAYVMLWAYIHLFPFGYWAYIHYLCWQHIIAMTSSIVSTYSLYSTTIKALLILQSIQWIEIFHTATKLLLAKTTLTVSICELEKRSAIIEICQLAAKFNTLMLCLLYAWSWLNPTSIISEESYSNNYLQIGYVCLLFAWSLAEVVRYPFYFCKLMEINTLLLEWLRYNAFIISYPIGIGGEMFCWYGLMQFLSADAYINDVTVNYPFGFTTLRGWAIIIFVLTPFGGGYIYYTMFAEKRNYAKSKND